MLNSEKTETQHRYINRTLREVSGLAAWEVFGQLKKSQTQIPEQIIELYGADHSGTEPILF